MYSRTVARSIAQFTMNPIVKILIVSDVMIWGSYQLLTPVFAIFVAESIVGGGLEVVGIATSIYFVAKAICEIPVGLFIDRHKGEKDDLYMAFFGTIVTALAYVSYLFVDGISELYAVQAFLGLGAAMAYPGWYTIFTNHVDKGKEGFEWSLYDVSMGVGMAAFAALGGFIAETFGFRILFIVVAVGTVVGSFMLLMIRNMVVTAKKRRA